jgi:hypothetical protein
MTSLKHNNEINDSSNLTKTRYNIQSMRDTQQSAVRWPISVDTTAPTPIGSRAVSDSV